MVLGETSRGARVHVRDGSRRPQCPLRRVAHAPARPSIRGSEPERIARRRDGRRLYATNPALGVVSEIDLATHRRTRTVSFAAMRGDGSPNRALASGAISRDGRTLYFSGGRDLWAYDAAYGRVRGPYRTAGRLAGFGYGKGDRRLYAVRRDGRVLVFDAAIGARGTR